MARVSADNVFRKVKIRMWRSGSFSRLSPIQPSGQSLWLYLLTCPESSPLPGAIVSGRAAMAEALGWDLKAFDKAFAEASAEGMAIADWKARLVWLPRGPSENPPANPNVLKSWAGHFRMLPDSPLKTLIFRELKAFAKGLGKPFAEAFAEAFGKGGAHQEQEQEQEQEVVQDACAASEAEAPPAAALDDPPLLAFHCDGKLSTWYLTAAYVNELLESFPSLDVLAECKKALAWVNADSSRRKTAGGMKRFLVGWMGRSQNHGSGRPASRGTSQAAAPQPAMRDVRKPDGYLYRQQLGPGGDVVSERRRDEVPRLEVAS